MVRYSEVHVKDSRTEDVMRQCWIGLLPSRGRGTERRTCFTGAVTPKALIVRTQNIESTTVSRCLVPS